MMLALFGEDPQEKESLPNGEARGICGSGITPNHILYENRVSEL